MVKQMNREIDKVTGEVKDWLEDKVRCIGIWRLRILLIGVGEKISEKGMRRRRRS